MNDYYIGYSWGSMNHLINNNSNQADESPDDKAF